MRDPIGHAGEEAGVVLEGEMEVLVAGAAHRLGPGDAIWFVSSQPHTFVVVGDQPCLSVWADTIPDHAQPGGLRSLLGRAGGAHRRSRARGEARRPARGRVCAAPVPPYPEALLSAVPVPDPGVARRSRIVLEGDVPIPLAPPPGCRFHTRCRYATELCKREEPRLVEHRDGHLAACHHPRNVGSAERGGEPVMA